MPSPIRIGIIGGGQLGCMMMEEATRYDLSFFTLDAADAPAVRWAKEHITGSLMSEADIFSLGSKSDVLTYEIEHINVEALSALEQSGKKVIPSSSVLKIIQNKIIQKKFYIDHKISTAPYVVVTGPEQWANAIEQLPGDKIAAKTATGGYDGKGVQLCLKKDILEGKIPFSGDAILEAFIPCEKELSVMVGRDQNGNIAAWETVEMVFDPVLNLVDTLICPARISDEVAHSARKVAEQVAGALNEPGVYAIEMFLTKDGRILVNETAPRPHNSGHHSIESAATSQFEQLVRILQGWPLGSTKQLCPAAMINLIGPEEVKGAYTLAHVNELLKTEGVYIHLYGKKESRPGRKLGHITITADSNDELDEKVKWVKSNSDIKGI